MMNIIKIVGEELTNVISAHLDIVSFVLALFSIALSYWFWRNPTDVDFRDKILFRDRNGEIKYVVGKNYKGWIVKRINSDALNGSTLKIKPVAYATIKNNPGIKKSPDTLEELERLNYE